MKGVLAMISSELTLERAALAEDQALLAERTPRRLSKPSVIPSIDGANKYQPRRCKKRRLKKS